MSTMDAAEITTIDRTADAPPTVISGPRPMGRRVRQLLGGLVAIGCTLLLALAAWMTPAADGLGTHQQLNMPPCGWVALMDLPCPTCGMTTAFAHAADGHLLASLLTQPLGFILALSTAMALLIGSYTAATGSRIAVELAALWTRRTTWLLIIFALVAWGYKILTFRGVL